jgi:hypothetical protein
MRNITFQSIRILLVLILLSFFLAIGCAKKEVNDPGEVLLSLFLYQNLTSPVCSSFTPESAPTLTSNSSGSFSNNPSSSIAVSVPAGKQCYFKFVAPTSNTYIFEESIYNDEKVVYHVGLVNKMQTKIPSSSSSFDSENIFTNLANRSPRSDFFYLKANSYRIIMVDGSSCQSSCKITFLITKDTSYDGCTSIRGSQQIPSSAVIRFDESGVSIPTADRSSNSDCYYLFVSPGETVSQLTQTKTYTGGTSVSMVLSVSSPITSTASTFTSSAANTNATAATLSGLSTPTGQGRYVQGAYSNSSSTQYSFTLSNSY